MPERYKLGLTDLVARCTARADQVSSMEFQAGATGLLEKMIKWRPIMYAASTSHSDEIPGQQAMKAFVL